MKKIQRLIIENFQSHEYSEFTFDEGLNVIIGASDQGKSAVIRALRWVLYNEPRGADFIRVGSTTCRVTIEWIDGSRVSRERTPSKNRYMVALSDGEEQVYEGFSNQVPHEVIAVTGIEKVMLDEDTETALHLGMQLEAPFLLSETGAVKAKAVGRLNGVHIIDAAHRDTTRDIGRLSQEERTFKEQLESVDEELQAFSDLPYLENLLDLLEERQKLISDKKTRLEKLKYLREQRMGVQSQLNLAQTILLQTKSIISTGGALLRLEEWINKRNRLILQKNTYQETVRRLTRIEVILLATKDINQANQLQQTVEATATRLTRLQERHSQQLRITKELKRLDTALQKLEGLKAIEITIRRLESLMQNRDQLKKLYFDQSDIEARLKKADQFLEENERELRNQLREYAILLKQGGVCPVCYGSIDDHNMERILQEFAGGGQYETGRKVKRA